MLLFKRRILWYRVTVILGILASTSTFLYADEPVEFNTDILNIGNKSNIDLSKFSTSGYTYPGTYEVSIQLNEDTIASNYKIDFIKSSENEDETLACIPPKIVDKFSLKEKYSENLTFWNNNHCIDSRSLPGMSIQPQLSKSKLLITIPQAYLSYSAQGWDPPARWDDGISGLLFDYRLTAQNIKPQSQSNQFTVSGQGTTGVNIGSWRLRADWQSSYDNRDENKGSNWKWSQVYGYRAIKKLSAKLIFGENYSASEIFDNIRYLGATLSSEDNMLPPNLRGYAPQISGVTSSNAKIIVSQKGRVIYETTVSQGPFSIQDINESISGILDVRVEEDNGKVQQFQVNTSSIPYLTRPDHVRYKVTVGKPSDIDRNRKGPLFSMGEFSWGINNGWSVFGGAIISDEYNALSGGIGRDLLSLGAISIDMTSSFARNTNFSKEENKHGNAYRINYSKRFDEYNSQVTLAGYRFAERNYLTLNQFIDNKYYGGKVDQDKELYVLTMSQGFPDLGINAYISYSHRTYWNNDKSTYLNASISKYFDFGSFKNNSININGYRNQSYGKNDNGVFVNLNIPLDMKTTVSMNSYISHGDMANTLSYNKTVDENNNYNITGGVTSRGRANVSGYYRHYGDMTTLSGSASYIDSVNTAATVSIDGGVTITPKGGALHRINMPGNSRVLMDTQGVKNVPINGNGPIVHSNYFGKAVLPMSNDYMRSQISVNLDNLPKDIDAKGSVQQFTLTEGAIGYRTFSVSKGSKVIAKIMLENGEFAPFGSVLSNQDNREIGIVSDNGVAYLGGVNSNDKISLSLPSQKTCRLTLPELSKEGSLISLLLVCK